MSEKTAAEGGDVDLFGDPWTEPKDRRGRRAHKRLAQIAEKVAVLRGSGKTVEEIAARIGLDPKTLNKYYSRELEQGPALAQAVLDEVMFREAMKGKVSAARYMRERFKEGDATLAGQRLNDRAKARREEDAAPKSVGLKEQRQAEADLVAAAGGKYAPPSAPRRLQ